MKPQFDYTSIFKIKSKGLVSLVVSGMISGVSAITMLSTPLLAAPANNALPTGAAIKSGAVNISTTASNTLNINQSSNKSIINWNTYNIGKDSAVNYNFSQTGSSSLNRVLDNNPSQIFGKLNANGNVVLINPNGIIFGSGSSVNVGSIVASTMNIKDEDYLNNKLTFSRDNPIGKILNEGTITAEDKGYIALLSPEVVNSGVIKATMGTISLVAGDKVELSLDHTGLKTVIVEPSTIQTLIDNKSLISADGGNIYLGAKQANKLLDDVMNIRNSGIIEASSPEDIFTKGGKIVLEGQHIENSGAIQAKGKAGGGEILIGGDWQGTNEDKISHAQKVTLTNTSNIDASAKNDGDGGKVVVWSSLVNNGVTTVDGTIKAEGGKNSGDGGKIETSGGSLLFGNNINTSTKAYSGKNGQWLLDPYFITIDQQFADIITSGLTTGDVTVSSATNNSGVVFNYGSTDHSYIKVESPISWSQNTLTLKTDGDIYINAPLAGTGSAKLSFIYGLGADNPLAAATNTYNYFINAKVSLPTGANFSTQKMGSSPIYAAPVVTYQVINTLEELQGIANHTSSIISANNLLYYALGSDIDATSTSSQTYTANDTFSSSGMGFRPIGGGNAGYFYGKFNGLGHTIDKLYIKANAGNAALFGSVLHYSTDDDRRTEIRDLKLTNLYTESEFKSGGLIAQITTYNNLVATPSTVTYNSVSYDARTLIFNVSVSGNVKSGTTGADSSLIAGGLVADASTVSIKCSKFEGSVEGIGSSGGLVGYMTEGLIRSSYASANVKGGYEAGGLVGYASNTKIYYAYAMGSISTVNSNGNDYVGGLIGKAINTPGIYYSYAVGTTMGTHASPLVGTGNSYISSSYYDKTVNTIDNSNAYGLTTEQMKIGSNYQYWGIESLSGSYPTLYCPTNTTDTPWRMATPLAYHLSATTQIYKGSAYNLADYYSASSIFGSTYSSWSLGADYNFIYNNQVITGFTDAGTYSNISIDILKSGFTEATTGNALGTFTISPFTLTTTSFGASNKIYDGLATATISGAINKFGSDDVSLSGIFGDKNVGTGKTVTASLTGAKASNYTLGTTPVTTTANISKLALTSVTGITASDKIYDGTTSATIGSSGVVFGGKISGDVLSVTSATALFDDKNVGNGKNITISSITLGGTDANNYDTSGLTTTTTKNITAKPVTLTAPSVTKEYDGGVSYTPTQAYLDQISTALSTSGDDKVTAVSISYANKDVGTGNKSINFTSATIDDGNSGNNYNITYSGNSTSTISKRQLTLNGALAQDKVYDGTTSVNITSFGTLSNKVGSEDVGINTIAATASFLDKNVADSKVVNISNVTLSGEDANNYSVSNLSTTAKITAKPLTISGLSSANKTYDATTTAVVNGTAVLQTAETAGSGTTSDGKAYTNDTVNLIGTATGNFNSKDVATASTVSFSGISLSGTDAGNYTLTPHASVSNTITPKPITVTGLTASSKTYDGTATATLSNSGSLVGVESIDNNKVSLSTSATFNNKNVENIKTINLDHRLSGDEAGNYSIANVTNEATVALITPKPITYTIKDDTKIAGQPVTLQEPVFSGGTPTGGVSLHVYDNSDTDVTSKVTNGILLPGKYKVKVNSLSDANYEVASVNNTIGNLTINSNQTDIVTSKIADNIAKSTDVKQTLETKSAISDNIKDAKVSPDSKQEPAQPSKVQIVQDAKTADASILKGGGLDSVGGRPTITSTMVSIANPFSGNDKITVLDGGVKVASMELLLPIATSTVVKSDIKPSAIIETNPTNQTVQTTTQTVSTSTKQQDTISELKQEIPAQTTTATTTMQTSTVVNKTFVGISGTQQAISTTKQGSVEITSFAPTSSTKAPEAVLAKVVTNDSSSFSFTVKEAVVLKIEGSTVVSAKATVVNGQALPSWLKFDGATQTFLAINPPANALPISTKVTVTGANGQTSQLAVEIAK